MQRCAACGRLRFPPGYLCRECHGADSDWVEVSGRGTIASFTVMHRAPTPAYAARAPYVLALVDLQEGPRMMANVIGEDALQAAIGDPVEVVFEARGEDGFKLPQFRRAAR